MWLGVDMFISPRVSGAIPPTYGTPAPGRFSPRMFLAPVGSAIVFYDL
ncbi:MAG TPA: hypothetical protein VMR21_11650 [Vicinamibacteria bacterium]|nr:hypothetical protein [Vicinamibacteria bacterium]